MQLERVYRHPCDEKTGALIAPKLPQPPREAGPEMTLEEELALAEAMMRKYGVPEGEIPAGLEMIRRKRGGE